MLFKRGMSDSDIALAAIDAQIEARDKKIAKLLPTVERLQQEREALVQSRAILAASVSTNGHHKPAPTRIEASGQTPVTPPSTERPNPFSSPSPVLEAVDEILEGKELHVDEIIKALDAKGHKTTKAVLTTSLARRAAKGKRYRRVEGKPNTFARLRDEDYKPMIQNFPTEVIK
jgi:hypothetical protein